MRLPLEAQNKKETICMSERANATKCQFHSSARSPSSLEETTKQRYIRNAENEHPEKPWEDVLTRQVSEGSKNVNNNDAESKEEEDR